MAEYKNTLNLPKTDFSMKANLAQREPERLQQWQQQDLYQQIRQLRVGAPKYILHDGPPYANGKIHLGHAVNKVLKDIVIKSKSLSGFDAPYVPGWDCHGLPIELNVEKKLGKANVNISAQAFRQACREYADSQIDLQRQAFIRLGVFGDWQNPYKTMNFNYEADIIRSLAKVIDNGHLQQGFKPVHWCLDCRSSLAEAEVEYYHKQSPSIDVAFTAVDGAEVFKRFHIDENPSCPVIIPIWTTTPWTLPANQAVALHSDINYVLIKASLPQGSVYLVLAQPLMDAVLARYQSQHNQQLAMVKGAALEKLSLQHPFFDKTVLVVLGDHVTVESGTGAVHTAPAHGREDYQVCLTYHIEINNPVLGNGCYKDDLPLFAGLHVFKANAVIVETLKKQHKLLAYTQIDHSYPHCWRHKSPLIFRATPQWFINLDQAGLREKAFNAIKQTSWLPKTGEARITDMIENHPGWCISRQRLWGVPLSLLVHKQSGQLHPNMSALLEVVAERVSKEGVEAAFAMTPFELLDADEAAQYEKLQDTLDVWYDSGVSHFCVLQAREQLQVPADLYLEGSDQHRGWFQSSLISSLAIDDSAPYKTVLTHGFTVDEHGHKMSKSIGNVIEPEKIINTLGADILRLWISSVDFRYEMPVSNEIINRATDTYRRLRNTARFMLANLHDFDPSSHLLAYEELLPLDQYAIDATLRLQNSIIEDYDHFRFQLVVQKLHGFCSVLMGGFYLDVIKDRQYTMQANAKARRSTQTALYHVLQALVRLVAPILSFTADELWGYIPGNQGNVFLTTWYGALTALPVTATISYDDWQEIQLVRDEVNKALEVARKQGAIGAGLQAEVTLYADDKLQAVLNKLADELHFIFITSTAVVKSLTDMPATASATERADLTLQITASAHAKCERCWHYTASVGCHVDHPTICSRCVENVIGNGEKRHFA